MSETVYLELTWGTSRGRDTYGYNIARLRDTSTGKRFRCMGGGYDMIGTVFGDWLQETHQYRLREISDQAHARWTDEQDGKPWRREQDDAGLYGMSYYTHDGRVVLDGACGINSMERVAKEIGLSVRHVVSKRGNTTGFIVTDESGEVTR